MELALSTAFVLYFQLDFRPRRFLGRNNNVFQIEILVGATQVLDLKTLDLNSLDQTLVISIQSIQHIDQVVLLGVGGGIVQRKQWIEFP